ncbi:hypothetical protein BDP81DRAFT_412266 [Colletotrichum phormii]|uniref:Secreted protein n=1 Tax=Colletotrichum phormii TaxID=359342 RepID=A0AAJ0A3D4_9PEZI|nr:uncharacterized protein BDP81DRAFT_412266 [Colletotrichum phormii]KAK1655223.1 hypothetical protein BDP81DRAFT_412266 [Colletotrichum phormii]
MAPPMLASTWIYTAAAAAVTFGVAQDRAELAGSDKANVRRVGRECCHAAMLHLGLRTREHKTRQPSRLFLPWRVGVCQNPAAREEDFKITKDGTRRLFRQNGVSLMIQRARQYKKKEDETILRTHAAPEGGQMRWKYGEMRRDDCATGETESGVCVECCWR